MSIRVLIADDHHLVRQGLRALLEREFDVVGEAANGQEATELVESVHPDVAVLDLAMPVLNGIDAVREIQRIYPQTKTIILSMHTDCRYILEGLRAGAKGFVMKTHAVDDLARAIREAARGEAYMSPEISDAVVKAYQNKVEIPPDPLSPRERQVLQLLAEGESSKEVASKLKISVKTAETYRTRIMTKLDIHQTANLVRYAVRKGVIQP
jgi:two-component system, NarL family, response regulator NreC